MSAPLGDLMRSSCTLAGAGLLALGIAGVSVVGVPAAGPADAVPANPTFTKDVLPIFQRSCQDCHRPGQVAPFALLTYDQARKRADDLAHVTGERRMPPWPASRPGSPSTTCSTASPNRAWPTRPRIRPAPPAC